MMEWTRATTVAMIAAIGCAHAPTATPAATSCEDAARHVAALSAGATLGGEIRGHCARDGWAIDARRCYASLAAIGEAGACEARLAKAQRDALAAGRDGIRSRHQTLDFEDDTIEGDLAKPGADFGNARKRERDAPARKPKGDSSDPCEGGQ